MLESDPSLEQQSREMFAAAPTFRAKKAIRQLFSTLLHDYLDQIKLGDTLYITDPFLFNAWSDSHHWYVPFVEQILLPLYGKVSTIIVFVEKYDLNLIRHFKAHALQNGCQLRVLECELYHDRIWLSGASQRGVYVGASLTGIGNKYTFVNILPDSDAKDALDCLRKIVNAPLTEEL